MNAAEGSAAPQVSVVMIFRDAARFMVEAIESVCVQTLHEWELLLVDDGSTDGSSQIAEEYADADPRIRRLAHEGGRNRGMAASRALGVRAAVGRHLAFLDADDVYLPERLARHVEALDAHPEVDVVVGATVRWRSWNAGAGAEDSAPDELILTGATPGRPISSPRLLAQFLDPRRGGTTGICSLTVRRAVAPRMEGVPESFTGLFEDQCLYVRILSTHTALTLDEPLAKYRQHRDSHVSTSGGRDALRAAELRFLRWVDEEIRTLGIEDPEMETILAKRLLPHRHPVRAALLDLPGRTRSLARRTVEGSVRTLLPRRWAAGLEHRLREAREAVRQRRIRRHERAVAERRPRNV